MGDCWTILPIDKIFLEFKNNHFKRCWFLNAAIESELKQLQKRICQNYYDMASKQEVDVLDNWEDIDESDVLDQKFSKLLPPSKIIENKSCNGTNGAPINIILTGDDALRSQYVPPEPTVTILKRPTKENHSNSDNKIFQPKKTLKQREQEYAEARLRILGEAHSTDKPEEKVSSIQNKPRPVELENVIRLPKSPDGTRGFTERR